MKNVHILWVDDEIDLLKPHILFLEEKGYTVSTASNGEDAYKLVSSSYFDLVFLDENMPGLSGLETLNRIKSAKSSLPVVMITKSEEEDIMDAAIGSKIADYLIKPVNPKQILLSIKKNTDTKRLITKETTSAYQSQFSAIGTQIANAITYNDWTDIYKKLTYWELELQSSSDQGMQDILDMQKKESELGFSRYIKQNYLSWFSTKSNEQPLISPNVFKNKILPEINEGNKTVVILIDNLRFDQWKSIYPLIADYYNIEEEDLYCSILPTATQYARNAFFAGLMPMEIQKLYPDLWIDEVEENGKNQFENKLLQKQLERLSAKKKFQYEKISQVRTGKKLVDNYKNLLNQDFAILVYNFIDMLSHANTESEFIRELAGDDSAYRSITQAWFKHSYLLELLAALAAENIKIVITTDHGAIRVNNPLKVIGDRNTSSNLRYKAGKNLNYKSSDVFEIKDPSKAHLPQANISTRYIFATNKDYLVYPNNYNYYVNYFRNTFQHGGISLEEMLIPLITLRPK